MSFFLKKGSKGGMKFNGTRKRKVAAKLPSASKKKKAEDEEILSDDSEVEGRPDVGYESEDEDEDKTETAEDKRIRLAQKYLEEIEREEKERAEDDAQLKELINARLKTEDLEERGKLRREVAGSILSIDSANIRTLKDKNHKLSVTCVVVHSNKFVYSSSKDSGLIKWDLNSGAKLFKTKGGKGREGRGHSSCINALAVSSDGHFLASGGDDKIIHVWNPETMEIIKTFRGHRDAVSGLAFRINSHTLYSCAYDRSVKIWSLDEMAYVETLFGHQDKITGIDAGRRERAITSGGRDGSVRVWKIIEESQLVFNGPSCSTDSVRLINEEHFITAGEDGHLSLWGAMKKKPLFTVSGAHGKDPINEEPFWISAIAAYPLSDLVASGSRDGFIRLWKCCCDFRKLEEIHKIPITGFVNALSFSSDGKTLVAGIGQEHRLGRWWRIPEARNSVIVISISYKDQ